MYLSASLSSPIQLLYDCCSTLPEVRIASTTFRVWTDLLCPSTETVAVPLQIFLMIIGHVLRDRGILTAPAVKPAMGSNPVMIVKNFDRCVCHPHINLVFDKWFLSSNQPLNKNTLLELQTQLLMVGIYLDLSWDNDNLQMTIAVPDEVVKAAAQKALED